MRFTICVLLTSIIFGCSKNKTTTPPVITPPRDTTPVVIKPYQLVWSDEFDKNGMPDTSKWGYDVGGGGWGNNELQYYTDGRSENARVENGNLIIETRKETWAEESIHLHGCSQKTKQNGRTENLTFVQNYQPAAVYGLPSGCSRPTILSIGLMMANLILWKKWVLIKM